MPYSFLWKILIAFVISSCTTTAWVVQEEPLPDPESRQLISERRHFLPKESPSAQNPFLNLELVQIRDLQYNRHLVSQRYIQRYKPRYGYLALGLGVMGFGLYLSNGSSVDPVDLSGRERALLNISALSVGMASFLAMKPAAEPVPAGEQRMLGKKDTWVYRDTVAARITGEYALLSLSRGERVLVQDKPVRFDGNRIRLNLVRESGIQSQPYEDTTGLAVMLEYQETSYLQFFPREEYLQEYVEVLDSTVPLRTAPAVLSGNIIRHVGPESRFPLVREVDRDWYQVLLRGSSAYLAREHARKIWYGSDAGANEEWFANSDAAVFGDLEIERDLPDYRRMNPDGIALIMVNGNFRDPLQQLPDASRTAQLASLYANRVMGYYSDNILLFEDMTHSEMRELIEQSDSLRIGDRHVSMDESDLFIYYFGHAFEDSEDRLSLVPVDYDPWDEDQKLILLDDLVDMLSEIRARQTILVLDTDWSPQPVFGQDTHTGVAYGRRGLEKLSNRVSDFSSPVSVFYAASAGQRSLPYRSVEDVRGVPYGIFTWYFFKSLQEGWYISGTMQDYIDRNVAFTSRRLHEHPQDPGFLGSGAMPVVRHPRE